MRKQDLIQLHRLLLELSQYMSEENAISTEWIVEYDMLDTRPIYVQAAKEDHQEAVMMLATAIEAELDRTPEEDQEKVTASQ